MTVFANNGAWHASEDPRLDSGYRPSQTDCVLEVIAPDHIRTRVETPLPNLRGSTSRMRHSSSGLDVRAPDTTLQQVKTSVAKALPTAPPSADVMAHTALDQVVCFTPGARILTGQGERALETLQVGDMVVTRDQGLRPIRWIGQRTVQADGLLAPIELCNSGRGDTPYGLLVSPHHRILYTGHRANMLFGASEVLVAAKDLVNGRDIRRRPVAKINYIHLMFDHHEVIYADGIATESFQATDPVLTALDETAREAVFSVFPELRTATGRHLVPARACVSEEDARILSNQGSDAASYS
ncbi:Hint domain-containing protein [Roseovarius rhodophyticola]|uniref:Hint domain-containing protein n=1 Tax=Roseovarius rhodophyticola TaxID=3080827 RepID=A0ABZ2TGS6_9RHOB|nr:Hint domain-containing protein [Roseovarius sp. W115]MDV2929203.1 Hint domain-containing protein [Roseovarius sp. W115]